jgi:cytochrome P450
VFVPFSTGGFPGTAYIAILEFDLTSLGPYGCVGKQLALMEIRNVMARIVTEFDVTFAPGEDGTKLLEESHDTFTIALAPLELVFTRRERD